MSPIHASNLIAGHWQSLSADTKRPVLSAVDRQTVAYISTDTPDMAEAVAYARQYGDPALRKLRFHERATLIKKLALYIKEQRESLYALSTHTGATRKDSWIDIDGGINTMLVFASKGKRELQNETFILDGPVEHISREGSFVAQHLYTTPPGVAVHINAYNFPCWGLLEKLAPALLAGIPVIAKAASSTSYLAYQLARLMQQSGLLPNGAFQFIAASTGDVLQHLGAHDTVAFTGSAATAALLRSHTAFTTAGAKFIAEQDSLNGSILAPDAVPQP